jgi:LysM repeat protein
MSSPLILGTFTFSTDDLPDKIEMGGQQIVSIYQYPGGVKDVQVFGALDDPIQLTGTFNYSAQSKVKSVDKMFKAGGTHTLKVGSFKSVLGIITKFKPVYRSAYAIDYTIEFEPLKSSFTSSAHTTSIPNKPVSTSPKSNKPAPRRVYTVVKGDSLWKIAKKYYGSGTQYPHIMTANKLKTTLIKPGQKLVIP